MLACCFLLSKLLSRTFVQLCFYVLAGCLIFLDPLQEECKDLCQRVNDGLLRKPTVVSFLFPLSFELFIYFVSVIITFFAWSETCM